MGREGPECLLYTNTSIMKFQMLMLLVVAALLTGTHSSPKKQRLLNHAGGTSKTKYSQRYSAEICPNGASFPLGDSCNWCFCDSATGASGCTMIGCPRPEKASLTKSSEQCPNGASFPAGDGCNWCFCDAATGASGCTIMGCPRPEEFGLTKSSGKCPKGPNYIAEDGCNGCFCDVETGIAGCTLMACPQPQGPSSWWPGTKSSETCP